MIIVKVSLVLCINVALSQNDITKDKHFNRGILLKEKKTINAIDSIQYSLPGNISKAQFVIMTFKGELVKSIDIDRYAYFVHLKKADYKPGTYYYAIITDAHVSNKYQLRIK